MPTLEAPRNGEKPHSSGPYARHEPPGRGQLFGHCPSTSGYGRPHAVVDRGPSVKTGDLQRRGEVTRRITKTVCADERASIDVTLDVFHAFHASSDAGTDSYQARHVGVVSSGRLAVRHEDGTDLELNTGDAYIIEPGHDAWVVGDERFVAFEFESRSAED